MNIQLEMSNVIVPLIAAANDQKIFFGSTGAASIESSLNIQKISF